MLTYHPSKDPYHCIYRILCILYDLEQTCIDIDLLKILDFYVLFPSRLKNIKLPQMYTSFRKIFKSISEPYEILPSDIKLISSIETIQQIAIKTLIAQHFIDGKLFLVNKICFIKENLTTELLTILEHSEIRTQEWYKILTKELSVLNLYGSEGLKSRTNLLEYQYDAI